ncbi:MAG: phosphatase PAP2 family protein [Jatrophihabitans sp.]
MPNLQLDWQQSAVLAVVLIGVAAAAARVRGESPTSRRVRALAPFGHEAGIIAVLYSLWMLAATLAENRTSGAFQRGRWIHRTERTWHLPSEKTLQDGLLHHRLLAESANLYYATMHFTALFVFLLWLFIRHRDRYKAVRTTVAIFTALSLLIQFIPVAPPRLLPEFGYVDVAQRFGQSVYTLGAVSADQLSAMPSVHVGWAVLIGAAIVLISTSPWRWLFLLHPVMTVYVVTATANHWWADGIVSAALVALVATTQWIWVHSRRRRAPSPVPAGADPLDDPAQAPVSS